jgi:hypothetical protein
MTTRISSCCQEEYSGFANSRHLCHDETRFRLGPSLDKAAAYCGLVVMVERCPAVSALAAGSAAPTPTELAMSVRTRP